MAYPDHPRKPAMATFSLAMRPTSSIEVRVAATLRAVRIVSLCGG